MSDERTNSAKIRRDCFERHKYRCELSKRWLMDCYICGLPIDVIKEGARWHAEHVKRRSLGHGNPELLAELDSPENIKPAHESCHAPKTAEDVAENAKGKRVASNHFGLKKRTRSMPGGRDSPWKFKIDGTREKR